MFLLSNGERGQGGRQQKESSDSKGQGIGTDDVAHKTGELDIGRSVRQWSQGDEKGGEDD
jgi:hypothetical protein